MENPTETAVGTSPVDPLVPMESPVRRTHSDGERQPSGSGPMEWATEADGYRVSDGSVPSGPPALWGTNPQGKGRVVRRNLPFLDRWRQRWRVEVAATSGGGEGGRFLGRSEGCQAAAEGGDGGGKRAAMAALGGCGGKQQAPGRPAALAMPERGKGLRVCVCGVPVCSSNRIFNEVWSDG
ncbi:hypothetical protein Cgig2_012852 [Carnegiea gigantea]|uniref:Uncharacterized protein n=1 Tax=Carnegiea gigantea TaxID=171969 RepID=A0A9Q1GQP8_9CARY|nr:hypothetical protein Cgig2_012852 [Carnegiea gigantea]